MNFMSFNLSYATPTPSLCDNCEFSYHMGGGMVFTMGKAYQQRYCEIQTSGSITESGYSSCPTHLLKIGREGLDYSVKWVAIRIHGRHPDKTAEEALAAVIESKELQTLPDVTEKIRAALIVVKDNVAKIPLTRTP